MKTGVAYLAVADPLLSCSAVHLSRVSA